MPTITSTSKSVLRKPLTIKHDNVGFMQTTCVSSEDNSKSNDSNHIFAIRKNTRLKHRCHCFALPSQFRSYFDLLNKYKVT